MAQSIAYFIMREGIEIFFLISPLSIFLITHRGKSMLDDVGTEITLRFHITQHRTSSNYTHPSFNKLSVNCLSTHSVISFHPLGLTSGA